MFTGVPANSLKLQGHFPDFLGFLVVLEKLDQLWLLLQSLLQGHARLERDHFGQLVSQTVGFALNPGNVPHNRLRRHGAEGNDLRHRLSPVLLGGVLDYPVPAFHAEVDVKVGHGDPFRVQETLEQQVIL